MPVKRISNESLDKLLQGKVKEAAKTGGVDAVMDLASEAGGVDGIMKAAAEAGISLEDVKAKA